MIVCPQPQPGYETLDGRFGSTLWKRTPSNMLMILFVGLMAMTHNAPSRVSKMELICVHPNPSARLKPVKPLRATFCTPQPVATHKLPSRSSITSETEVHNPFLESYS